MLLLFSINIVIIVIVIIVVIIILLESPTSFKILLLGYLSLEIWDRDFGNPDDFIGRLVIPLSSLPLTHVSNN